MTASHVPFAHVHRAYYNYNYSGLTKKKKVTNRKPWYYQFCMYVQKKYVFLYLYITYQNPKVV